MRLGCQRFRLIDAPIRRKKDRQFDVIRVNELCFRHTLTNADCFLVTAARVKPTALESESLGGRVGGASYGTLGGVGAFCRRDRARRRSQPIPRDNALRVDRGGRRVLDGTTTIENDNGTKPPDGTRSGGH